MERLKLLIIDENPRVRNALATRLAALPEFDVNDCYGSIAEMQQALQSINPDVVLIEPKRLNGQGYSLIQSMTSRPNHPQVIVLTSYPDEDEKMVTEELGVSCYLLKDIDSESLRTSILSCHYGPLL